MLGGKTELLKAAQTLAIQRGMHVFNACGSDLERDFAYGVVRQLFEAVPPPGGDPDPESPVVALGTGVAADNIATPAVNSGR